MSISEDKIPVIVGVGQLNDRPENPVEGMDSLGLMIEALKLAEKDAGGGSWLKEADGVLVVDQISFSKMGDLSGPVAEGIGASPKECRKTKYPMGDSPVRLLNEAANMIGSGEAKIVAVTGAEALRTAAARAKAAAAAKGERKEVSAIREASNRRPMSIRDQFGLSAPVDVYPLYENAGRASYGQTFAEAQRESGEIWSRFSKVAEETDGAWIKSAKTPEEITTADENNRPISFPYTKLMVANSSVNQGAGFIVTSLAEVKSRGIPEDQLIYVGQGASAVEPGDFLKRDNYTRSVCMSETLTRTLDLNGLSVDDLDYAELYSCFPCVPKMARRVIGWPVEKPATVFGGLTFGGGPIANYMSHAIVAMVQKLRESGKYGFLFANGGFATNNHTIVIGRDPELATHFPQDFDYQAEADAARGPVPSLIEDFEGDGTIETYTVHYKRDGSVRFGVIVGLTADGTGRFLAKVPASDAETISFLTDGKAEPVGTSGKSVSVEGEELKVWLRS
jgi:acetyl-CoA C-acetyltransferase